MEFLFDKVKRESNTGAFPRILQNFKNTFFTNTGGCFMY